MQSSDVCRLSDGTYQAAKTVAFSQCDHTQACRPSSLLRLATDLAGDDYADRGLPHDLLWEEGCVFLVSRIRFRFARSLRAEERVIFHTWERCVQGPFCVRDYAVRAENGEPIAEGSSSWILCDPQTRRILRPKQFPHPMQQHEELALCEADAEKIVLPEELAAAGTRQVRYSDLDGNGHVNNAIYADIACDALPIALFQNGITEFSINFIHETKCGDVIALQVGEANGVHYVCGTVDGAVCFTCAIRFRQV